MPAVQSIKSSCYVPAALGNFDITHKRKKLIITLILNIDQDCWCQMDWFHLFYYSWFPWEKNPKTYTGLHFCSWEHLGNKVNKNGQTGSSWQKGYSNLNNHAVQSLWAEKHLIMQKTLNLEVLLAKNKKVGLQWVQDYQNWTGGAWKTVLINLDVYRGTHGKVRIWLQQQ